MRGKKDKLLIRNAIKLHQIYCKSYCDIFPSSEIRILRNKSNESEVNLNNEKVLEKQPENVSKEFRVNEVNIQMISKNIYDQLFKPSSPPLDANVIKRYGIEMYVNNSHRIVIAYFPYF